MISSISSVVASRISSRVVVLDVDGAAQGKESHRRRFCQSRAQTLDLGCRSSRRCVARLEIAERAGGRTRSAASASTGCPTASHMRRTWRLRPSRIVSSITSPRTPAHLRGRGRPVLELDARRAAARSACRRAGPPPTRDAVGLGHLKARVGEAVGELAVVGQQDQAAAVDVQTPDGIEAQAAGAATRSTTVGRPWVSLAVETTPSGLCRA